MNTDTDLSVKSVVHGSGQDRTLLAIALALHDERALANEHVPAV